MKLQFPLTVLYTQVTVFRHGLPRPGLLWDDDHVAQGFAWDEETVAFGVPDHDGQCWISVDLVDRPPPVPPAALWGVEVPFLASSGRLDIGTVGLAHAYGVPVGQYALAFLAFGAERIDGIDYAFRLHLQFFRNPSPEFKILKQGDELQTDTILRKEARRA